MAGRMLVFTGRAANCTENLPLSLYVRLSLSWKRDRKLPKCRALSHFRNNFSRSLRCRSNPPGPVRILLARKY